MDDEQEYQQYLVEHGMAEPEHPWKGMLPQMQKGWNPPSPAHGLYEQQPGYAENVIEGFIPFSRQIQGLEPWRSPETVMEAASLYAGGKLLNEALPPTVEAIRKAAPEVALAGRKVLGSESGQIGPVYHGSPYKFTKFANEAIGSGEGAQARGWGHYVSEVPEVAKTYSEAGIKKTMWGASLPSNIIELLKKDQNLAVEPIRKAIKDNVKHIEQLKYTHANQIKQNDPSVGMLIDQLNQENRNLATVHGQILSGEKVELPSYLYEATLHKGKTGEVYLEWEKPLSNEAKNRIVAKAEKHFAEIPSSSVMGYLSDEIKQLRQRLNSVTGAELYSSLGKGTPEQYKSKWLSDAGISGIKYPTGTMSGMKDTGKFNYVVFDPEEITIEKIGGKVVEPEVLSTLTKENAINEIINLEKKINDKRYKILDRRDMQKRVDELVERYNILGKDVNEIKFTTKKVNSKAISFGKGP
jgi:hypothetical protein